MNIMLSCHLNYELICHLFERKALSKRLFFFYFKLQFVRSLLIDVAWAIIIPESLFLAQGDNVLVYIKNQYFLQN
jgi:hypothetical protein